MQVTRRRWIQWSAGAVLSGMVLPVRARGGDWTMRQFVPVPGAVRPVISDLCFDTQSGRLASAGDDHLVRVWDVARGVEIAKLSGHRDWVRCVACHGPALLSGGNDRTVRRWDWLGSNSEGEIVWQASSPVVGMAFSNDGKWFAVCCFAGDVHWFSTSDWQRKGQIDCRHSDLRCLAFSPDSRSLVASGRDGTLHLVDLSRTPAVQSELPTAHRRRRDVLYLDDNHILSVGDDGLACSLDTSGRSACHDLRCERGRIYAAARINQQRIATAGSDNLIHIWDLSQQQQLAELAGHTGTISALVWTGSELISAGYDTTIRAWKPSQAVAVAPGSGRRR